MAREFVMGARIKLRDDFSFKAYKIAKSAEAMERATSGIKKTVDKTTKSTAVFGQRMDNVNKRFQLWVENTDAVKGSSKYLTAELRRQRSVQKLLGSEIENTKKALMAANKTYGHGSKEALDYRNQLLDLQTAQAKNNKAMTTTQKSLTAITNPAKVSFFGRLGNAISGTTRRVQNLGHQLRRTNGHGGGFLSNFGPGAFLSGTAHMAMGGAQMALLGGATAAAAAPFYISTKAVTSAAQHELDKLSLKAMLGSQKKGNAYMSMVEKMAIDSPMLNSGEMFKNSKGIVSYLKDTKNPMKNMSAAWRVVEKLVAMNPDVARGGGTEGAAFALRELFSGDAISMVERFNLPRKALNEIKKLKPEQMLKTFDKFISKMGYTNKFITEIGAAAVSQWNQIREKIDFGMRLMGEDGLKKIKPELVKVNRWLEGEQAAAIRNFGSDMIAGFLGVTIEKGNGIVAQIQEKYMNNPRFKNLSLEGKVKFVAEDLGATLGPWVTETAIPAVAGYGVSMGLSMAKGLHSGLQNSVMNDPTLLFFLGPAIGLATPGPIPVKVAAAIIATLSFLPVSNPPTIYGTNVHTGQTIESPNSKKKLPFKVQSGGMGGVKSLDRYASGMWNVPYDDMPVRVHKGETILPAYEAEKYRQLDKIAPSNARSGGGSVVTIGNLVENLHINGAEGKSAGQLADEVIAALYDKLAGANLVLSTADKGVLLDG